jgi:hypothetical protein
MKHLAKTTCCAALLLLSPAPSAQWSSDPGANQAIAAEAYAEVQPKIVPTSDGGFFVSWFANDPGGSPAGGYDVRIQRLDATGTPGFSPSVLVADRGFSSTQDYGLAVNAADEALLIFRDDRPVGTQITAAKVDASGALSWGALGVQLTATPSFVASPKIAATPDGGAICAWTQDADTRVRRLDAGGSVLWASDLVLSDGTNNVGLSDLQADGAGGALVSAVLNLTFSTPRHLELRRISPDGFELFRTAVFDGGSLQFGNFPSFIHDGSGGAVLSWYTSSPALESRVQRIAPDGAEVFPHNGVTVSTNTSLLRVSPHAVFDAATDEVAVFYTETNTGQNMDGISGQKFDAAGNRLWGSTGTSIVPMGPSSRDGVRAVGTANETIVAWTDGPSFGNDTVDAAVVDGTGTATTTPFQLSSPPATKFRLNAAQGCVGYGAFVWRDERAGNADIYAQNLGTDGTLGPIGAAGATVRNGSGVNPLVFMQTAPAIIGTPWGASIGLGGASLSAVLIAQGGPHPGLPLAIGELLCLGPFLPANVSTGTHSIGLPLNCALVGRTYCMQGAQVFLGPVQLQLTNALDVTIGAF